MKLKAWPALSGLAILLAGAPLAGQQAPTNNSSRPLPDSLTNEWLLRELSVQSRTALERAREPRTSQNLTVRRLAERMHTDHTDILSNLQSLWNRLGYTAPDSGAVVATTDSVAPVGPAADDWDWLRQEIAAHSRVVQALNRQVPRVGEPDLRAFAANVIATEETHLRDAQALYARRPAARD